tara:strand:- start:36 stop:230 length:195 start_codon:yes stop_codon:yes gene_type:complete
MEIELEKCNVCDGTGDNYKSSEYNYDNDDRFYDCENCNGIGQIAYIKINDKKCKLSLEIIDLGE